MTISVWIRKGIRKKITGVNDETKTSNYGIVSLMFSLTFVR